MTAFAPLPSILAPAFLAQASGAVSPTEAAVLLAILVGCLLFFGLVLKKVWGRKARGLEEEEQEPAARVQAPAPKRPAPRPEPAPEEADDDDEETLVESLREEAVTPAPEEMAATLREGLQRTRREGFMARLRRVLSRQIAPEVVDEMEEVLLTADIGVKTATQLLEAVRARVSRKELADGEAVLAAIRAEARRILDSVAAGEDRAGGKARSDGPEVILVVGVNGTGKTTTLGKLAARAAAAGRRTLLVAGDTFRAAATGQLEVWAGRTGAAFHAGAEGSDPASVIFDGIKRAEAEGYDLVLCDTAGRLHTNANLVEELKKIARVAAKARPGAPHATWLVLDATIGQNAVMQARSFTEALGVTGIVLTKLDGTARGGVVLGIVHELGLPIEYAGVGEKAADLRPFAAAEFLEGLFAREEAAP